MKYDVVLFDLDGTLTESAPGIIHSARIAVEQMGYKDFDPSVFQRFIGPPLHESFRIYFGMTDAQADEAIAHYRAYYADRGIFENAVYPGMPNLLRQLKAEGARLYVATAKPERFMHIVLEKFGIARFFDGAVGATMDNRSSNKSELVRAALPKDADPRRSVMIGDRRYDIEAGRANGIDTIGVCYGYGNRAEVEQAGATYVADTVEALSKYLVGDMPAPQGLFVTVEGLDGSGKTTQIDGLAAYLRQLGYEVLCTREPGGSPIAEKIRHVVLSPENLGMHAWTEALLYAAARAEHVQAVVRPALAEGKVVLCDRFVDSSVVYQGVGRGLGIENVLKINALGIGGIVPDWTLYLRLDVEAALHRRRSASSLDRIEMEQEAFHRRALEAYETLWRENPQRICAVDASQSAEEIAQEACARMDAVLAKH